MMKPRAPALRPLSRVAAALATLALGVLALPAPIAAAADDTLAIAKAASSGPVLSTTTTPTVGGDDGDQVVLTFDKALDESSVPAAEDFSWTWTDGSMCGDPPEPCFEYTPRVTKVVVAGSTVTLTLLVDMYYGDTLTVSYTPGADPIRDTGGVEADAFTDTAVTTTDIAQIDPKLTAVQFRHAGSVIPHEWTFDPDTTSYDLPVSASIEQITLWIAKAPHIRTRLAFFDGNGDPLADADPLELHHQVELASGATTTVTVKVIGNDAAANEKSYTFNITRP